MFREKQFQGPSIVSDRVHLDVQDDPAIAAEVERLLARRTRDIRLKGEIKRLFRARIWSQTAKDHPRLDDLGGFLGCADAGALHVDASKGDRAVHAPAWRHHPARRYWLSLLSGENRARPGSKELR